MEILESQDPDKKKLIETSERHKRALEKEVTDVSERTQKMLTNALVIGGALALSYLVVSRISKTKTKKKRKKYRKVTAIAQPVSTSVDDDDLVEEEPGLIATIGSRLASNATAMLVDLARQKLMDYLESRKKNEAS